MGASAPSRLITVGSLARRTGMSRKTIRELEGLGLIYSAGRSEANYRLFDEQPALWCVSTVRDLRSLGLELAAARGSFEHRCALSPGRPRGWRRTRLRLSPVRRRRGQRPHGRALVSARDAHIHAKDGSHDGSWRA